MDSAAGVCYVYLRTIVLPFRDLYPEEGWIQELELDMKFTSEFWVYGGGGGGPQVDCLA